MKYLNKHNRIRKKYGMPPLPLKNDKEYFEALKKYPSLIAIIKGINTED